MDFPKLGNNIYYDGVNWIVVGIGDKSFEYTFEKGIFAIVNLDEMDCVLLMIRKRKFKIIIDPSIPSVKADDEELLKVYGNSGTYALLQFDKNTN